MKVSGDATKDARVLEFSITHPKDGKKETQYYVDVTISSQKYKLKSTRRLFIRFKVSSGMGEGGYESKCLRPWYFFRSGLAFASAWHGVKAWCRHSRYSTLFLFLFLFLSLSICHARALCLSICLSIFVCPYLSVLSPSHALPNATCVCCVCVCVCACARVCQPPTHFSRLSVCLFCGMINVVR